MEVSNEIKEDIRKTQSDFKNAIRIHQVWVARLQGDENSIYLKKKVREAEKEIIEVGQAQKLVIDRLRRELQLYQQRSKQRNRNINIENDNKYVATQLRDHQIQHRNRNRTVSLLKPSVLNELHIKGVNNNGEAKENNISDSEHDLKSIHEKENSSHSDNDGKDKYARNFAQFSNTVHNSRSNFVNVLKKVKESLSESQLAHSHQHNNEWQQKSDSDSSSPAELSPTPSPPLLPEPGQLVTKTAFLRLIGLVTPSQRELLEKKRNERRKRSTRATSRNQFIYGNFEMSSKRKKYNQFSYLQTHNDPPQTRSQKLRKQQCEQGQKQPQNRNKTSPECSPSGSSTENKGWTNGKPAWAAALPDSLSVEPVYANHNHKKPCHACGRNDVTSLLVWCESCLVWQHTACGSGGPGGPGGPGAAGSSVARCLTCDGALPEPDPAPAVDQDSDSDSDPDITPSAKLFRDKLAEHKSLQEKNFKLSIELRKLEARAANLKENLDEHNAEKRQLLADQINTQRNLQKLLDCISRFKDTSISIRSTSVSESGSEISKSYEE